MTDQVNVKKTGRFKKVALFVGVYIALWILTAVIGSAQVRNRVEPWEAEGASGVAGGLRLAHVSAWSPCPLVVVAEKANIGVVVNPYEGSTSSRHVQKRWFVWLFVPIEV